MKKSSHVSLSQGKTLKLTKLKEVSLKCNEGTAWITNPGDTKDYILREGDILNLSVTSRAPVVIGCMNGHVSLEVFSL